MLKLPNFDHITTSTIKCEFKWLRKFWNCGKSPLQVEKESPIDLSPHGRFNTLIIIIDLF